MNKLFQLRRLNLTLALKVIFIYLKRFAGFKWSDHEIGYISYLFTLEICNLKHVSEENNYFKVMTSSGVQLYLRRYPSSDSTVLHQIWTDNEYQIIVDFIKDNFKQPEICIVDAGANVGYTSLYFFHHLKNIYNVKLIVIEPNAANLEILAKNFLINDLKNYYVEKAGLYNKSCYLRVVEDFRDGRDWSLRVVEVQEPTDLKSIELLSLLKKYNWDKIDFCKIDIEGSEHFLFQDNEYARRLLEDVKLMSIEIHDDAGNRQHILEVLNENKFKLFDHGELTIAYSLDN